MRSRVFVPSALVALVMMVAMLGVLNAQGQGANTPNAKSGGTANAKIVYDPTAPPDPNFKAPKTPWGDPDIRGYYLNSTYTPLERPRNIGDKQLYTVEEAVDAFKKSVALDAEVDPTTVHYDWKEYGMDAWQSPIRPNRRTSMIIDPPDGRIPALTDEARKRREAANAKENAKGPDVQSPGTYTRCVTGNGGPPRVAGGVTVESQIMQSPGYVTLTIESNYDVRIIPISTAPHLAKTVKTWLGDARAHFEGDTLIVDTVNFNDERNWRGSGSGLHLVEKFKMADNRTLLYTFTVDDPSTWTKPWTAEMPIPKIEPPLYEFACHEQNYGLYNWTTGSMIREKEGIGQKGRAEVFAGE